MFLVEEFEKVFDHLLIDVVVMSPELVVLLLSLFCECSLFIFDVLVFVLNTRDLTLKIVNLFLILLQFLIGLKDKIESVNSLT